MQSVCRLATIGAGKPQSGIAELDGVASIPVGLPQDPFRVGDIGYRLAVIGEEDALGGNAPEEGLELFALRIESGELAPGNGAHREDLGSVLAWDRPSP